jgi:RNA polymerase sigma-70 factor (ECF subfamily)
MNLNDQEDLFGAYHEYRPNLLRLLVARAADPGVADDLLQELWVKLQQRPPGPVHDAKSYLFRMAENLLIDRLRAQQRRMARERRWLDDATNFAGSLDEQVDTATTAEQALLDREEISTLVSAIANLPGGARRAFELHKIQGLSHTEVALRLRISKSGVEKHMAVAMKYLRRALMD